MKRFIIPIFITHKGCKFNCIFCNQRNIADDFTPPERVKDICNSFINSQINKFGEINSKYKIKQISFYGGSFTCIDKTLMLKYLNQAYHFVEKGDIDSLRLSTRPDCITQDTLDILKSYSVKTIEIGAQTLNDEILHKLERGHSVKDVIDAAYKIKSNNIELGVQLMIGLPDENYQLLKNTLNILTNIIKPDFIRLYPLIVIKGTDLEQSYLDNKFKPISLEEAVKRSSIIVDACLKSGIEVVRIGLQMTENLYKNIVAGPYSPNFGDMVLKNISKKEITNFNEK